MRMAETEARDTAPFMEEEAAEAVEASSFTVIMSQLAPLLPTVDSLQLAESAEADGSQFSRSILPIQREYPSMAAR